MTMYDDNQGNNGGSGAALARVQHSSGAMSATETAMGDRSLAKTTAHTHAMAVRQTAEINAQFTMALARPRDLDTVRLKLLKRCEAKRFAEVARYKKPQGKKQNEQGKWVQNFVEGWSIRFVEEAIRSLGNIKPETMVTADDAERRMIRVCVTDMEANIPYTAEITVNKTVERKELKRGQVPLAARTNSYGDPVYILPATDDEVRMSEARLVSMTLRTLGLRLIPGDILDECLEVVLATQRSDVDTDPTAARKRLVDAFASIGVRPVDLVEYLGGRPLDALTPDLILELRGVYQTIREEGVRWADVLASSPYVDRDGDEEPKSDGPAAKVRAQIEAKAAAAGQKDKEAAARRQALATVAEKAGVDVRTVQSILQLVNGGKTAGDIARYSREQTGIEDEVLVGEVIAQARAAGLLPPAKAPEMPATTPATEPAKGRATGQRGAKPRPSRSVEDIAGEAGCSVDLVTAIIALAESGEQDVAGALRAQGRTVDEPTVAMVLAAIRK